MAQHSSHLVVGAEPQRQRLDRLLRRGQALEVPPQVVLFERHGCRVWQPGVAAGRRVLLLSIVITPRSLWVQGCGLKRTDGCSSAESRRLGAGGEWFALSPGDTCTWETGG